MDSAFFSSTCFQLKDCDSVAVGKVEGEKNRTIKMTNPYFTPEASATPQHSAAVKVGEQSATWRRAAALQKRSQTPPKTRAELIL